MSKNICCLIVFFTLMLPAPAHAVLYQAWAAEISPGITIDTLRIILNNIFVAILLWGAALAWRYITIRLSTPHNRVVLGMYSIYLFFFAKEAYRTLCMIREFSKTFDMSCIVTFCTLVLPHGILEYMAFMLIAVFAYIWIDRKTGFKPIYAWLPALTLLVAGVLETTLTDYIFKAYLLANI